MCGDSITRFCTNQLGAAGERVAASAKAWSYLMVEANGLRLSAHVLGAPGVVYDEFVIDRAKGELAANIRPERRARIERLRK